MKYIISENRIKEILSNVLDNIHIRVITDGKDMIYPSGNSILGNPPMIWNKYIKEFGPLYIIKYGGVFYVAQYQKDGWMITDESGYNISENDFIESLGLENFGFDVDQLINMVKNKT
jgi:hypothetical protein